MPVKPAHHVLLVDDEPDLRWVLRSLFEDAGFEVSEAADGRLALESLESIAPDVILSDVRMPDINGLELLRALRKRSDDVPVVLLSAMEDIATAVEAIRDGAFDYQAKPYDPQRLLLTVQRAAEQHTLKREIEQLRQGDQRADFGRSPAGRELDRMLGLVARQPTLSVLLEGESGTGKEVVAREIHRRSPCHDGPFVAIDCGALPEPLMESQLFGHKRGAFTGADRDRPGLFQQAEGGTLFLDELGNLPVALQAKLLRALQERVVVPVGGTDPVPFGARLICATNASLDDLVQAGKFRMDLYHRIAEITLRLPSLRERAEDIPAYARMFLAEACHEMGRRIVDIEPDALQSLGRHDWPGNLRELRNVIRRAVLMCNDHRLCASDLVFLSPPGRDLSQGPAGLAATTTVLDEDRPLADQVQDATLSLERELLKQALQRAQGNKAEAARRLQIDYTTLHRKLKRHGLIG